MSPARHLTVLGALVTAVLAAPASSAEGPQSSATYRATGATSLQASPSTKRELQARVANLAAPGNRAAGMPVSAAPGEQLSTATFDMDFSTGKVLVTGSLAGPPAADRPWLSVQAGVISGSSCNAVPGELGGRFLSSGYTNDYETIPPGWNGANCVIALVFPDGSTEPSDALVGALTDEVVYPVLSLGKPEILGVSKLKLVPGVWTPVSVEVFNSGTGLARAVVVSGKGKGVKVKPGTLGYALDPAQDGKPDTGTVDIQVKLDGKVRKAKLTLEASSDGEAASSKVTVKATKAPPAPRPGQYASKDGAVTFTIKGGKVSGFRVQTQTQCGGYPDVITYTSNTYDFPTTKINRAGIVDARDEHELYTANLEMLVSGAKVTRGEFTYSGPARCFASESFDAKRKPGKG